MAQDTHIKNPIEWSGAQLARAGHNAGVAWQRLHHIQDTIHSPPPKVARIGRGDVRAALAQGYQDFGAYRSDVAFLCLVYAAVGIVLARVVFGAGLLPLLFPLASGFAIIGPFAAVGLYEMSKRREQGAEVSWTNAFDVIHEENFGAIAILGLLLIATFLAWIGTAWGIYAATLGPALPASAGAFFGAVFTTPAGWAMIAIGIAAGFCFALFAMALSIVSFPLLLDDPNMGLDTAIRTSFKAVRANPGPMAAWGIVVTAGLVLGSIPLFTGLIVVLPVLGHATWHLYRRLVVR